MSDELEDESIGAALEQAEPESESADEAVTPDSGGDSTTESNDLNTGGVSAGQADGAGTADLERQYREQVAYLQQQNFELQQRAADYAWRMQQASKPQQPTQAAKQDEQPWWKPVWSPPEGVTKETFLPFVDPNDTSKWKPGTPPQIIEKYEEWKRFHNQFDEQFRSNPLEYMYKGLKDKFLADARQEWQQQQESSQKQQTAMQFVDAVKPWAQATDAAGNPIYYTDERGQPRAALTPAGQRFSQLLESFKGVPLEVSAKACWALMKDEGWFGQPVQQQPAVTPEQQAEQNEQRKRGFVAPKKPGHTPNRRIAAAADPRQPDTAKRSLADMAKEIIESGEATAEEMMAAF